MKADAFGYKEGAKGTGTVNAESKEVLSFTRRQERYIQNGCR